MIPLPPLPSPTPLPQPSLPTHILGRRHFYTCDSVILEWQQEWYTAPFYSASSSSYDAAASLGPVNPPLSVLSAATECRTAAAGPSGMASGSGGIVIVTSTSGGSTFEQTITSVPGASISTGGSSPSATPTASALGPSNTMIGSSTSFGPSGTSLSATSSSTPFAPIAQATDPSAITTCAGDMDFQAWGAVSGAVFTVLIGGLLWLLWAVLRGRIPAIYSPRTYFVPSDSRPSKSFSLLAFLFPFLPSTSSSPGSAATSALPVVLASLKLLVLSSLVALAVALPLFVVNNPCLSETSPTNYLGGRLGTLSDLSLLRLLNSLDPSPDSPSRDSSISLLQSRIQVNKRALPQTIGPALSSARVRLIVILVLIGLLSLGGGLWVVTRAYAKIWARRRRFEQETCGGMEMVVVAGKDAPGWKGMSEEILRKTLSGATAAGVHDAEEQEITVIGVFCIPDTILLRQKVAEREASLLQLEAEEAHYLLDAPGRNRQPQYPLTSPIDQPNSLGRTATADTLPPLLPSDSSHAQYSRTNLGGPSNHPGLTNALLDQSRFREINRNSLQSTRFEIGQRVKIDKSGKFVTDSTPDSHRSRTSSNGRSSESSSGEHPHRVETSPDARIVPGPERQLELQPSPPYRSVQPSAAASPITHPSSAIERSRLGLKQLNDEVESMQLLAMRSAASGRDATGWVIVGRGVRFIPGAIRVEGYTIEDIDWAYIGKSEGVFWAKVALLGFVLALILIPFIGLANASAPGLTHYLPFLTALGRSDGLGSGVVQAFVPGLVMFLVVLLAIRGSIYLAHRVPTVSRSRRDLLATQATFWLLLALCIVWALLVSSMEFAVQALAGESQKSRAVADGSVYSTWWIFVFLLNVAIILPAIILLQPRRLLTHLHQRRKASTPRAVFRAARPSPLSPALLLAGPLLAVLYTLSLSLIFPLLCLPLLILLYLSFIVLRHMTDRVFVDTGFNNGHLALWLVRRLGWCLGIQPALYGLILLSRREWAIGGISCGVAVLAVILSEALTARRIPEARRKDLKAATKSNIDAIAASMRTSSPRPPLSRSASDSSMLQRLTTLLPGYSRLPSTCPLPLRPHKIDDMAHTELASVTRRDLIKGRDKEGDRFFHDPTEANRGLIYPPEMLQPVAVVWLPYTAGSEAEAEAAELEGMRGLIAIVDPGPRERRSEGKVGETS